MPRRTFSNGEVGHGHDDDGDDDGHPVSKTHTRAHAAKRRNSRRVKGHQLMNVHVRPPARLSQLLLSRSSCAHSTRLPNGRTDGHLRTPSIIVLSLSLSEQQQEQQQRRNASDVIKASAFLLYCAWCCELVMSATHTNKYWNPLDGK